MFAIKEFCKKNERWIVLGILFLSLPLLIPLLSTITEIIFTAGTYIGSLIRSISEGKIC